MLEVIIKDVEEGAFKNVPLSDPELCGGAFCVHLSPPLPPKAALPSAVYLALM